MSRLILILILTFSFQSLTKADDIRDFEIEGMGIGDSLLSYMNKNLIANGMNDKDIAYYYEEIATNSYLNV